MQGLRWKVGQVAIFKENQHATRNNLDCNNPVHLKLPAFAMVAILARSLAISHDLHQQTTASCTCNFCVRSNRYMIWIKSGGFAC